MMTMMVIMMITMMMMMMMIVMVIMMIMITVMLHILFPPLPPPHHHSYTCIYWWLHTLLFRSAYRFASTKKNVKHFLNHISACVEMVSHLYGTEIVRFSQDEFKYVSRQYCSPLCSRYAPSILHVACALWCCCPKRLIHNLSTKYCKAMKPCSYYRGFIICV